MRTRFRFKGGAYSAVPCGPFRANPVGELSQGKPWAMLSWPFGPKNSPTPLSIPDDVASLEGKWRPSKFIQLLLLVSRQCAHVLVLGMIVYFIGGLNLCP
jgi:hypothetical protein